MTAEETGTIYLHKHSVNCSGSVNAEDFLQFKAEQFSLQTEAKTIT